MTNQIKQPLIPTLHILILKPSEQTWDDPILKMPILQVMKIQINQGLHPNDSELMMRLSVMWFD